MASVAAVTLVVAINADPASADDVRNRQWHLRQLNIADAQRHSRGENVVIAFIDTGVDANHQDLRRNVLRGIDIVAGGTGDGRADSDGHGTAIAALAAAHGRGDDGVMGIAPEAKILPVRIHTPSHEGDTNDGARAVDWAVDHGAKIICDASGGGVTPALVNAIVRAQRSDVVVVAAAGNRPKDTGVLAPASLPGVVAAAATDRTGNHYSGSVTGPEIVLAAPGVDIVSASKNGGYRDGTGTSDAAAIIAGAAALVRARYPGLSAEEVIRRLTDTADDRGPKGRDEQYGYGVLNLVKALTAPLGASSTPPTSPTPVAANTTAPGSGGRSAAGLIGLLVVLLLAAGAAGTVALVAVRRRQP